LVLDTSALLAIVFNEDHGPWCLKQIETESGALTMSTVNWTETLILIEDRQPRLAQEIVQRIALLPIQFLPPTMVQAEIAALARLRFPLNLGDCFAYALAKDTGQSLLTLDRDFVKTDLAVIIPLRLNL